MLAPSLVVLSSASAERASPRSKSWKIEAPPPCLRQAGRLPVRCTQTSGRQAATENGAPRDHLPFARRARRIPSVPFLDRARQRATPRSMRGSHTEGRRCRLTKPERSRPRPRHEYGWYRTAEHRTPDRLPRGRSPCSRVQSPQRPLGPSLS